MAGDGEVAGTLDAPPFDMDGGQRGDATCPWFWNAGSTAHFAAGLRIFIGTTLYDMWYYRCEGECLFLERGNKYSDVAISPAETIDYDTYSYVINWRPVAASSNLRLCGFRLFYYQPVMGYLPLIRR
jgi:hypothetical protein